MYKTVEKVLVEYVFTMLKGEKKVRGRVCERMGGDATVKYSFAVSHYYGPSDKAPEAVPPAKTEFGTREEAERNLYAYIRNYTGVGLAPNPDY